MKKPFIAIVCVSLAVIIFSFLSIVILNIKNKVPEVTHGTATKYDVRVAVLNGCGRAGLASMFAHKLRNEGFDVVNGMGENADSFDFDISVVVDRKGAREKAEAVGKALGIREILDQHSDDPYLIEEIVVILGRDWNTLLKSKEDVTY